MSFIPYGEKSNRIRKIQRKLNHLPFFGPRLTEDGHYGPATARAILAVFGDEDGIKTAKVKTLDLLHNMMRNDPYFVQSGICQLSEIETELGRFPKVLGLRATTFGGPSDKNDRLYGQAFLDYRKSPGGYYRRCPELTEAGLFRDVKGDFPIISGYKHERGKWRMTTGKANASWLLNPEFPYCAIPGKSLSKYARNDNVPLILIVNANTKAACVSYLTDYGPGEKHADIDMSPGSFKHVQPKSFKDPCVLAMWAPYGTKPGLYKSVYDVMDGGEPL